MTSLPLEDPFAAAVDLSPAAVARFLRTTGWERVRQRSGVMSVWRMGDRASVLLPEDESFDDYRDRLTEALQTVGRVHGVRGPALSLEIASASSDILLLRADQYLVDGSIPIREAESLVLGARKMLTAAALSAMGPKPNFGPARPATVKNFIEDDVRMGHTLRGSFVITILASLDDDAEVETDDDGGDETQTRRSAERSARTIQPSPTPTKGSDVDVSYTRRVMTTLATGLSAAVEVLDPTKSADLDAAVELGVSAQLLDSIAEVSGYEGIRSVSTTFRWSPSHPAPAASIPERVLLPRTSKERSEVVKERLRRRPSVSVDQVIGPVVRLERSEGDREGMAVVDGFVGRERKKVRLRLAPSAYALATAAHERREQVVVEGEITVQSGSYWILSPRRFEEVRKDLPPPSPGPNDA